MRAANGDAARRGARRAIALAACAALASACATAPAKEAAPRAAAAQPAPAEPQPAVTWDPAVLADFEKDVPRFVKAMARTTIEDMARERGTNYVDRALYEEALEKFKR